VGNTVEASWAALLAGKSGIAKIKGFDASAFTTHFAGEVKDFNIENYISEKRATWAASSTWAWLRLAKPWQIQAWQ
jgi:3-oxoacyl-(acyl-carrier-protein) synthase